MTKKILPLILALCLWGACAAGCAEKENAAPESYIMAKPSPPQSESAAPADVDLTALSSTMVYAEVFNMMVNPKDYVGKTVKMSGPYYAAYYDETERYYHYVIVEDATACCQQGLEFVLTGADAGPAGYPADEEQVEVCGVFTSYEELGSTCYRLAAEEFAVLG